MAVPTDFAAFYGEHAESLLLFFTRRTYDVEVARDLTAETFAAALDSRDRFRGTTGHEAAAWLYAIATHRFGRYMRRGAVELRAVRKLGLQLSAVGPDEQDRVIELAGLAEMRGAVAHVFSLLSDEQRAAVRLRVVDDLSYPEVAERLCISESAARARVSRGLRQLAAALPKSIPTTKAAQ
jgi:RNA polymerase sigma-70 factor (ECF subfamily)